MIDKNIDLTDGSLPIPGIEFIQDRLNQGTAIDLREAPRDAAAYSEESREHAQIATVVAAAIRELWNHVGSKEYWEELDKPGGVSDPVECVTDYTRYILAGLYLMLTGKHMQEDNATKDG